MDMKNTDLLNAIEQADRLRDSGRLDEALLVCQAIVANHPDAPEAHYKLGALYGRLEQTKLSEVSYRNALSLSPRHPEANNNLGLIHMQHGDFDAAEVCYRTALAERPGFLNAHLNLGGLLNEVLRLLEAEYCARRAIEISPNASEGYVRLGQAVRLRGRITQSIAHFQRAVELDTGSASALTELGFCYWNLGRHQDAERALKSAIALAPDALPARSNLLLVSNYTLGNRDEISALHTAFGEVVRKKCGDLPAPQYIQRPNPVRRLRIGFLSGDFRRHAVAYFIRGALQYLDRAQFQLFAYHNFRTEDSVTWELKPAFDFWRSVYGLPDQETADLIATDRIDILIDLSGVTAGARPLVLGRKPAPIQVHWLGYPNTIGLDCIDYRLTDSWADPPTEGGSFYTEELWRLPHSFLCYSPPEAAPNIEQPPCMGRTEITFGSFNSRAKLSEECIAMWVEVLKAVPNSRFVLKSLIGTDDEAARDSLLQLFVAKGIVADRIEILLWRRAAEDHLAAYNEIDIALDTFPYHGTTTTCEALWMGVPVVTLAGDRHAARVGVSLLSNIGLDAFVANNRNEYVEIAVALAENREALLGLRQTMREKMRSSPLMDQRGMGADLGSALRGMWHRHCEKFSADMPDKSGSASEPIELLKLHIGGRVASEGWKILDAEPRPEVDFVGSAEDLSSFADESCSDIYCSHVLEHVGLAEILDTLTGFCRILAPGGHLYLSVPDLDVLAWLFASPGFSQEARFHIMRMMFGGQVDEHDFHRVGLNFDFMCHYLRDAGFSSIEHVESFGMFEDASTIRMHGHLVSLNLVVTK